MIFLNPLARIVWILAALSAITCSTEAADTKAAAPTKKETVYKKPTKEELKKRLTPEQYSCTQEAGTEAPFKNAYWNNKEDGIYVDVVSGQPLFSSLDKYDSGSGWPSFTKPIESRAVKTRPDHLLGVERTELLSSGVDSHLGHVFDDGPGPKGQRYCINSASLSFVPVDKLKEKNLEHYLFDFATQKKWQIAILAGGCFWGVEDLLRKEAGVIETQVGYTGGDLKDATYEDVKKGQTGHAEAVRVLFDPKKLSYEKLLLYFFKLHDPTTLNQQGNDRGTQYRSQIFFTSDEQKKTAEAIKKRVQDSGQWKEPIVTRIEAAREFWPAEEYHQKYLVKSPGGYTCHFVRDLTF